MNDCTWGSTDNVWYADWCASGSAINWHWCDTANTCATDSVWLYVPQPVRKILVTCPDHWTRDVALAFAHFVNCKIRSRFHVEMVIDGNVAITDPDIEVRTMANFVPLLKKHTEPEDHEKVDGFFATHPLNPPEGSGA